MNFKDVYADEFADTTLLFNDPITLPELGLLIANGCNYQIMEQVSRSCEGTINLRIKQKRQWAFQDTDGLPDVEQVYGRIADFYNDLHKHSPELLTIIWFQLCAILEQLGTLTVEEWDNMRKGCYYEAPVDFVYAIENKLPLRCRLDSAEKTVVKRLGSFPNVYEILVDFSPRTTSKRFDKERQKPIHSDAEIKMLAKEESRAIRVFFTLGDIIVVDNQESEFKTYKKVIRAIFDKSGMSPDEYNTITDEIGRVLSKFDF